MTAPVGEHTKMVRRHSIRFKKKQSRKYLKIICRDQRHSLAAASYAIYNTSRSGSCKLLRRTCFYEMKSLELSYVKLESQLELRSDSTSRAEFNTYWSSERS